MVSAKQKPLDTKRFLLVAGQSFVDQYYHVYNVRLSQTRQALIRSAQFRWGEDIKNIPLEQLNASLGATEVVVIGTLFKSMSKQPSILRELEDALLTPNLEESKANYTSDEDSLILHETDESVPVVGDIDIQMHVTGIPIALFGHQLNGGAKFHVTDTCYAGPSLSVYKMPKANSYRDETIKGRLLIVSGLEFGFDSLLSGEKCTKVINALNNLRDYVSGETEFDDDCGDEKSIVKVIIAGNSVGSGYIKAKTEIIGASEANDNRSLGEVFNIFDRYVFTMAQSGADIDIMPGKNDPTSFLLPQQPFHPKILPKSGLLENVRPNTNPLLMKYKERIILGTSGDNVDAIRRCSRIEFSTTILKSTLEWGHIAPCAPDSLSCYPYKEQDPFLIDFTPDIYFAGNQPEYAVTTYSTDTKPKIQIISVPRFTEALSGVVINLSDLDTELVSFS